MGGAHACKRRVRAAILAPMFRVSFVAFAVAAAGSPAIADPAPEPTELGGWFGPRIFSSQSALGYIDEAPAHPALENAVEFGARIAHQFVFPWLFPEIEVGVAPTHTTAVGGATSASVVWLEPRAQIRFELLPGRRVQPFLVAGVGAPIALSEARKTFDTGITGDVYGGAGVRFDSHRG